MYSSSTVKPSNSLSSAMHKRAEPHPIPMISWDEGIPLCVYRRMQELSYVSQVEVDAGDVRALALQRLPDVSIHAESLSVVLHPKHSSTSLSAILQQCVEERRNTFASRTEQLARNIPVVTRYVSPWFTFQSIARTLLEVLHVWHQAGIVLGERVCPGNLFVSHTLSINTPSTNSTNSSTHTSLVFGVTPNVPYETLPYASPERLLGGIASPDGPVRPCRVAYATGTSTDVWSLGIILFEIITGETLLGGRPASHNETKWNELDALRCMLAHLWTERRPQDPSVALSYTVPSDPFLPLSSPASHVLSVHVTEDAMKIRERVSIPVIEAKVRRATIGVPIRDDGVACVVDFLRGMLQWNPSHRATVEQLRSHAFLSLELEHE